VCPPGFEGVNCQIKKTGCDQKPCHNGASCLTKSDNVGYQCVCRAGFEGNHCEINIDDCFENSCLNNGTCIDDVNSYRCACKPGLTGNFCEINVDECLAKPCANGGTCIDLINDFKCTCTDGFTGKDCSINIDECKSNPCQNGAKCKDGVNEYICICSPGFKGDQCQFSVSSSSSLTLLSSSSSLSSLSSKNLSSNGLLTNIFRIEPFSRSSSNRLTSTFNQEDDLETEDKPKLHGLSSSQLAMISLVSALVPIMVIIATGIIIVLKRRKVKREEKIKRIEDEEVRRQNEANYSTLSKKCLESPYMIVNNFERKASLFSLSEPKSATLNSPKLKNEI